MKRTKIKYVWLLMAGFLCLPEQTIFPSENSRYNSLLVTGGLTAFIAASIYARNKMNMRSGLARLSQVGDVKRPVDPRIAAGLEYGSNDVYLHRPLSEKKMVDYLDYKLSGVKTHSDVNSSLLARLSQVDRSYDALDKIVDTAKKSAVEEKADVVALRHLEDSLSDISMSRSDRLLNRRFRKFLYPKYDKKIAFHEAGHAIANIHRLQHKSCVHAVSIIPSDQYAGLVTPVALAEHRKRPYSSLDTQDDVIHTIIADLSGLAAEEFYGFSDVKIDMIIAQHKKRHYSQDVIQAYNQAYRLVHSVFRRDGLKLDADTIVKDCYNKALELLAEHQEETTIVADYLIDHGEISNRGIYGLLKLPMPLFDFESEQVPINLENSCGHTDADDEVSSLETLS